MQFEQRRDSVAKPLLKRVLFLVTLVFFVLGALGGCAARKPAPTPSPPSAPEPSAARKPLPTDPREASRLAERLAREAAAVPGVNKATVVLSGSTAYVGLNLKAGTEAARTNAIKRDVAGRVKKAEPRLTRVLVTTDADTVTRLNRVASGVAKGKPVSAFADEMREIDRRMTPVSR